MVPPSVHLASATTSSLSVPSFETPSRPPSVASNFSSRRSSFLSPYLLPNISRTSQDTGLSPFLLTSSGGEREDIDRQIQPRSRRPCSRASSRRSAGLNAGLYSARPLQERPECFKISPSPTSTRPDFARDTLQRFSGEVTAVNPSFPCIPEDKDMFPILQVDRYERRISLPEKEDDYEFILPRMMLDFTRKDVPVGWTACTHPEGALYFFHDSRRIYTDANICNAETYEEVEAFTEALQNYAQKEGLQIPGDAEVVLEIVEDDYGETSWGYYYVDNNKRTLFWLHDFNMTRAISELKGRATLPHLKLELERYYWLHVEAFPFGHHLDKNTMRELTGILIHAISDQLTSNFSTVLFSVDTLEKMLHISKEIEEYGSNDETVCVHGRLMNIFAHPRFLNYHGQYGARLNHDQSVHYHGTKPRSFLIKLLAPALYNAPYVHLKTLEKIWIDETMCFQPWSQFIEKLKDEWQGFILFATVLLNANVAFLAIPSVDSGDNSRTWAQIVSFISIVASTGSIIIGLLLIRQYRVKPRENVEDAAKFLRANSHRTRGMETLAILYSLPWGLLMWGMVTFLGAFSLECFSTSDRITIITCTVVWTLVGSAILWCIYTAWESDEPLWNSILYKAQDEWYGAQLALRRCLQALRKSNSSNVRSDVSSV